MYVKIMLTLFMLATAILALVMSRPAPPPAAVVPPASFDSVLGTVIDSIEITDMPVEAAVRAIRDKTGVDIQVAWESFDEAIPTRALRTQARHCSLRAMSPWTKQALNAVLGPFDVVRCLRQSCQCFRQRRTLEFSYGCSRVRRT